MRQQPMNHSPGPADHTDELTVEQASVLRADQARLAAHYAERVEQARAATQYGAMRHWLSAYRRATMQCRLLGEHIRSEGVTADSSSSRREG
jgi:hypothetical protein